MSADPTPPVIAPVTATRVPIVISTALLQSYEALALIAGIEVEDYIAAHLARTREWTDAAPIYLNDAQAREVRRLLGSAVGTPRKELAAVILRLVTWKVGGWEIALPEALQEQIYWACKSAGRTVAELAPQLMLDAIREKFRA